MEKDVKRILEKLLLPVSEGWELDHLDVNETDSEIRVYVRYFLDEVKVDGTSFPIYDLREEREWRHLDLWQYRSYIVCKIPRYKAKDGKIKTLDVPWAEPHERISWMLEKKQ